MFHRYFYRLLALFNNDLKENSSLSRVGGIEDQSLIRATKDWETITENCAGPPVYSTLQAILAMIYKIVFNLGLTK